MPRARDAETEIRELRREVSGLQEAVKDLRRANVMFKAEELDKKLQKAEAVVNTHSHHIQASIQRNLAGTEVDHYMRTTNALPIERLDAARAYFWCLDNWNLDKWRLTSTWPIDLLRSRILSAFYESQR